MAKGSVSLNGNGREKKVELVEFITRAIGKLRTEKSNGIHTIYSGLADAARKYYGMPKQEDFTKDWFWTSLDKLVNDGKLEVAVRRGGKMVYLPGEGPKASGKDVNALIATILSK